MAQNYNQLEYLTRYVKAFEKNTRNRFHEQGIQSREVSPMVLESLYKMYNSLNFNMEDGIDDEIAKKIFDQVHPGFINYAKKIEKGSDKKRTSFLKSLFVGTKEVDTGRLNQYNSYRRIDIER